MGKEDECLLMTSKVPSLLPAVHCPLIKPPFEIHKSGFCSCCDEFRRRRVSKGFPLLSLRVHGVTRSP